MVNLSKVLLSSAILYLNIGVFYGQPLVMIFKIIFAYIVSSLIISNGLVKKFLGNLGVVMSDALIGGAVPFLLGNYLFFSLNLKWIVTNLLSVFFIAIAEIILLILSLRLNSQQVKP